MTRILMLAVFVAALLIPSVALAGPNDNSNDRPWTVNIGLGPMINLEGGAAFGKLGADFQYHFKGGDVGPALGAQLYTHFRSHIFGMNLGPIFLWDFRVYDGGNFKLYVAPMIAAGYGFTTHTPSNITGHVFFMDLGGSLKGVWNDRIGFFARPLNFSLWAGEGGATGFWTFVGGLTLSF